MKWVIISLAAVLSLSAGCSQQSGPPPPADTAHWRIAFLVMPKQPRQLDPAQFQVRLTDSKNKPVPGAVVAVGLVMPTMDMGRNDVTLRESPAGTYTGAGRFTMPGAWEAAVSADKGAAHRSQTFAVLVR